MNFEDLPRSSPHGPIGHLSIGGSRSYGLELPGSDWDLRGWHIVPGNMFLGIRAMPKSSWVLNDPDLSTHEVGAFLRLLAKAPSAHETLLGNNVLGPNHPMTAELQAGHSRLFTSVLVDAYWHQATGYAKKVREAKPQHPINKMLRNVYRCLFTSRTLATTGELNIRPPREATFEFGEQPVDDALGWVETEVAQIKQIDSGLPRELDWDWLNELLLDLRADHP